MIKDMMIKEIDIGGVYLPPLLGYLAGAALAWYVLRFLFEQFGVYRFVWHPPLFNTALYVILLSGFVAATL
jgi:protein AaeX